jgi:hypothetical protein
VVGVWDGRGILGIYTVQEGQASPVPAMRGLIMLVMMIYHDGHYGHRV